MYTQKDVTIEETLNKSYKHQRSIVKQLDVLCHQSYNKYLLSLDVCCLQDKIMSSSGDRPGSPHALKHFSFKGHPAMSTHKTFFFLSHLERGWSVRIEKDGFYVTLK